VHITAEESTGGRVQCPHQATPLENPLCVKTFMQNYINYILSLTTETMQCYCLWIVCMWWQDSTKSCGHNISVKFYGWTAGRMRHKKLLGITRIEMQILN